MAAALLERVAAGALPTLDGGVEDLWWALIQGVALVALRVAAERALLPRITAALKRAARGGGARAKSAPARAAEVVDNGFLALVIAPLSLWGWWVTLNHNGPCTPLAPRACLEGWPRHPVAREWRAWWLSVGGLYTGEVVGAALGGVGFKLSPEMAGHHLVTMVLMLYGYFGGLHRYACMATTVIDTSNTFLHVAKAVHAADVPALAGASDALFKLFAVVFFVVRVALPPFTMLAPGLKYGAVLPPVTYAITNGLMFTVYALQLVWFAKIVRIARAGGAKGAEGNKPSKAAVAAGGETAAVGASQ